MKYILKLLLCILCYTLGKEENDKPTYESRSEDANRRYNEEYQHLL